jgi:nicotinamidase-related amidase
MKTLIIIDLQKEFADDGPKSEYVRLVDFINKESHLFDKVIATYFKNTDDSFYDRYLDWHTCKDSSESSMEFFIDETSIEYHILKKTTYGAQVTKYLDECDEIYVMGCDSDACVMATCFKLWDEGYKFTVCSDLIYTTSRIFINDDVIQMLKRNFGEFVKSWYEDVIAP